MKSAISNYNTYSNLSIANHGVIQGSIFGPVLSL
jgi:hypothetical protein